MVKVCAVSVIIPYYNRAHTIERCLDSVVNQQSVPNEVLIVDDGSIEPFPSRLIQKYEPLLNLKIIVHKQNSGVSSARNTGIRCAKNDIVAFLDSDDIWTEKHIFQALDIFNKYPNVGFIFGAEEIENNNDFTEEDIENKLARSSHWDQYGKLLSDSYYQIASDVCFSRCLNFQSVIRTPTIVLNIPRLSPLVYFDEQLSLREDEDFCIRVARSSDIVFIKETQFKYYLHNDNTISRSDSLSYQQKIKEEENEIKFIRKKLNICDNTIQKDHLRNELSQTYYVLALWYKELGELDTAYRNFLQSFQLNPAVASLKHILIYRLLPVSILRRLYHCSSV